MSKKKFLRSCAPWVLATLSAAAEVRFGTKDNEWSRDIAEAAQVRKGRKMGFYLPDAKYVPSWGLRALAEKAGKRMIAHPADSVIRSNLLTEFERRRAARRAKEAEESKGALV